MTALDVLEFLARHQDFTGFVETADFKDFQVKRVEPTDDTDYSAMDALLKGWARWAAPERGPQPPTAAGIVLQIASVRDGDYAVRVSDDEFTLIDSRVATLEQRHRLIIELEYRGLWRGRHWSLSQEEKWRRLGVGHTTYGKRRTEAQRALFQSLKPDILSWIGADQGGESPPSHARVVSPTAGVPVGKVDLAARRDGGRSCP
jgi:hypothetical protein